VAVGLHVGVPLCSSSHMCRRRGSPLEVRWILPIALLANFVAGQARLRAAESEQRRQEAAALAEQQAALRRVATLVARGVDTTEVYSTAVAELSRGFGIDNVVLLRYASDEPSVLLASRGENGLS